MTNRDRRMTTGPDAEVVRVATAVANDAVAAGGLAAMLTGSHVRGDALPGSDIDVCVVGDGPPYWLERREPFLVSVSWRSADATRASFLDPRQAGSVVPGWRDAVILSDPSGIAAILQEEARDWTWEAIGDTRLNAHVAEALSGFAEEAHKLVTNRDAGRLFAVAVQRSLLATRLAPILAVHLRLLHTSENHLWDLVAAAMGAAWTRAQSAALGTSGESLDESAAAALELFALACDVVWPLFDDRQRAVVAHARGAVTRASAGQTATRTGGATPANGRQE